MKISSRVFPVILIIFAWACSPSAEKSGEMPAQTVKLVQINPGHFHAGLVLKSMYPQVDPLVHVYAPGGPDLQDFLARIEGYNSREDQPTTWETKIYTGPDYMERMLSEKPGNVMVTAGNNARKTEYILQAVEAGLNVFADKPMVISPDEFPLLQDAFSSAENEGVFLYDIMTERYEITTILQRELSMIPEVFGELLAGTAEEPAITKESVHHLFKYVSGLPLKRPAWFFDVEQQGTGLTDVGTHLVDLVQWECFPEQIIDYKNDIEMVTARAWATVMDAAQFEKVTGLADFPEYLAPYIQDGVLQYPCNGEMVYRLKGIYAKVSVIWNYQAPEGTGDTHFSIMRGSGCNLIIRQGQEEGFIPVLYIEESSGTEAFRERLETAISENISAKYPGVELEQLSNGKWRLLVPDQYRIGHEAHFTQVMEKYLQFLEEGKMPEWEVPNMIAKYYTTTGSVELTR
jgi:predicted dehydrogenase